MKCKECGFEEKEHPVKSLKGYPICKEFREVNQRSKNG